MSKKVENKKQAAPPASGAGPSILDRAFPPWQDVKEERESVDKYEDVAGLALPPETQIYLDTWKRPEELVLNNPSVPMLCLAPPPPAEAAGGKDAKGGASKAAKDAPQVLGRELDGTKLFAGHKTFEWLQAVFVAVMSTQQAIKPGEFLWELIHPKDKDGQTTRAANGKYRVKLYIMDTWRTVVIDDRMPVDLFGRSLLVNARPIQLWPLLLSKAVLKAMACHRILEQGLPHQVAAFQMLTGWPQEDLLDPLSGTKLHGGWLFDRLEDTVRGNEDRAERRAVASLCLIKRALPVRPPPRLVVVVGPSAVGRGPLVRRLVTEFPDKFGLTVSHTTRRPHEHEVHGQDYFFKTVTSFREEAAAGMLLEHAAVPSINGTHLYGTSFATVREVAATGKLCVMGLDVQGVRALRANKRIDGLYIFVQPPDLAELEARQRGRLKEDEATVQRRLAWAQSEVDRAAALSNGGDGSGGVIDHVVDNGTDWDALYVAVKEAISSLSPIIRNRLHGLPAYVLDYSDLIAPNLVEKPFLKPVVITGPDTGERKALMDLLAREFPDVFAFPRRTTTKPPNEDALYRIDAQDEPEQKASEMITTKDGETVEMSLPTHTSITQHEFEASAKSGGFLEHHTELFKHPLVARQWGVTQEAIREVIRSGRLPLLECETAGAEMLKAQRGIDCLTIFLKPATLQLYEERLRETLRETDDDIAARLELAKKDIAEAAAEVAATNPYDHVMVNADLDEAYDVLKRFISKSRPDILVPEEDQPAAPPPPPKQPVLVLCGPSGAGREALAKQLLATFPDKFLAPGVTTDRKPAKGEASTDALTFVAAKDLQKMTAEGLIAYQRPGEDKNAGMYAITNAALLKVAAEGKVAVLDLPDYAAALPALQAGAVGKDALYVLVASPAMLRAAVDLAPPPQPSKGGKGAPPPAAATPETALLELEGLVQAAQAPDTPYGCIVRQDDMLDMITEVREALAAHVPHIMPQPYRPLVVAGAFGTGKRVLLQRLFEALPGRFAVPVITTTRPKDPQDPDDRDGMVVVTPGEAEALAASGAFMVHKQVLGHSYGITLAAVKKVGASGRVPVVEVDHVEDAAALRARGFDATFLFIGMEDMGKLLSVIHDELEANPPLGYELQDAVNQFFATAKAEVAASRGEGLFDQWVAHVPDQPDPSFMRLAEAVHAHYPDVVTKHFVWGYGRPLWDEQVRTYGLRPLRVMVLGAAASGKTTQCMMLAEHFGMPHVNVGDLLFEEVAAKTELGLQAKMFMDTSKTVPDRFFFAMLEKRLSQPDCVARGWMLDGFPHTREQCEELLRMGIVPDKVILLEGEHSLLLDRTRYRRYDPTTGRVYHLAEDGALSPAVQPERPDGSVDKEVLARLYPRHDDSEENVLARLALADKHEAAIREAYEDVSLRLQVSLHPTALFDRAVEHLTLESRLQELQVVPSSSLKELQYLIIHTLRHRRRQLLKLQQDDGRTFWVDAKEAVGSNSHCVVLSQDPTTFPTSHQLRRVDLAKLSRVALLYVDSPEPVQLLASLFTGPQHALMEEPKGPRAVLVLSGPAAVGKSAVLQHLLHSQGRRTTLVPVCTTRPPLRREPAASVVLAKAGPDGNGAAGACGQAGAGQAPRAVVAAACCMAADDFERAAAAGQLMGVCSCGGFSYGVPKAELQAAWEAGLLPVVEAPLELGTALRRAGTVPGSGAIPPLSRPGTADAAPPPADATSTVDVRVAYLQLPTAELDVRLRLQDQREEADIGVCLAAAEAEAEARALGGASGSGGSGDADLIIDGRDLTLAYHQVKQLAAGSWRPVLGQLPGQLVLEAYDWRDSKPGGTLLRLRTQMANSALLRLPRGRHVLRINSDSLFLHAVTFLSATPDIRVGEYSQVVPLAAPDVSVAPYEGEYPAVPQGCTGLLFRYNLAVQQPTTVAAYLSVSGEDMRSCTKLLLVDRDTRQERLLPNVRLHATLLQPNSLGYCLLALCDTSTRAVAEDGTYCLTVTSTAPLQGALQEVPSHRAEAFSETYRPNSQLVVSRHVITSTVPTQLAIAAASEPRLPLRAQILEATAGQEITWAGSYSQLLVREAPDGQLLIPDATLQPGKYILMCTLDAEACPKGKQPDLATGQMPAGMPVALELTLMPSADEKACTIVADSSHQKYVQSVFDGWNAAPLQLAPAAGGGVAPGAKVPPKPAPGKGAVGARPAAAAALLDKYAADAAAEAAAATAVAATVSVVPPAAARPLKDGSTLELLPRQQLDIRHSQPPVRLTDEQLEQRLASAAEAAATAAAQVAQVGETLDRSKAERSALPAKKASTFSEWRATLAAAQKEASSRRAQVAQAIKASAPPTPVAS